MDIHDVVVYKFMDELRILEYLLHGSLNDLIQTNTPYVLNGHTFPSIKMLFPPEYVCVYSFMTSD